MSGFAVSPFGSGPFAGSYTAPVTPATNTLNASRFIDLYGRPEQLTDGSGDFRGMNNTMQRAVISVARAKLDSDRIGADFSSQREADIRTALDPLVKEGVLEIVSITAVDNGRSQTLTEISLRDLVSGKVESITR